MKTKSKVPPLVSEFTVSNPLVVAHFKFLKLAAAKEDPRQYMQWLHHDGKGEWLATDGHRLHMSILAGYPKGDSPRKEGMYRVKRAAKTRVVLGMIDPHYLSANQMELPERAWTMADTDKSYAAMAVTTLDPETPDTAEYRTQRYAYKLIAQLGERKGKHTNFGYMPTYLIDALTGGVTQIYAPTSADGKLIIHYQGERKVAIMPFRL